MGTRRHHPRGRPKAVDLRGQYATLPAGADLAPAIMDDPYGPPADAPAALDRGQWTPAPRPRIVVVRNYRHDPLGKMHARHHVSESEYLAGRAYQELAETAAGRGAAASCWDGRTSTSTGRAPVPVNDSMIRAGRRLRAVNGRVCARFGTEGLAVLQGVLLQRRELHQLAGAPRFAGMLLRQCLGEAAVLLGLASRGA